ncbi:unnamed protein product [Camellia sinensis]
MARTVEVFGVDKAGRGVAMGLLGVAEHSVAAFTRVLDEASAVLFFRDKVYLHPDKDKWRNMGISTAAHSSKEKIRIPRVKAITAGPLTNGQNSASASLIDDDKDGKTAPRWMHLDPCEGIYDNPLLYEKGWKKNLNYVIAFAKDGVYDVTKRYSRKWHEVLSRRNITTEPILSVILSNIRRECRQSFASQVISALEDQDRNEAEALERELHSKDDASISLPGRQSGDKEWRMSRSEFGSDEICFPSSSCCPARKCIDEHVTKIYNAFCPIISQFVEKSCSKSRAVDVLLFFKQMLINLKNSPFRTRRTSINPVSNGAQHLFLQMLPSFDQLFDALSLKSELDASGRVDIYLAADPVRTSIALPVLFHALDDVIHNVASAFDGTRMSKWEEPNGARGEVICKSAGISKKLGIIGFCFGGGQLIDALAQDGGACFGIGVSFYGTRIDPSVVANIKVLVLFIVGDNDPS